MISMANYFLICLPQASHRIYVPSFSQDSQTHMASFVHVALSHLQARMGKNKAFGNSYWYRVLKHSKIKAWTLAGQWKKILATNTRSWKKKTHVQDMNFNFYWKASVIKWLRSRQGQTVPSASPRENELLSFGGGLYIGHVGGAGLISHPGERQQEWEGLWYAYSDVNLWVWSSSTWWAPLTCKTLVTLEGDSKCKSCAIRIHCPSANSTLTCCCPNRATCIALHPCRHSVAEARLLPLLGHNSSKAKEKTSVFERYWLES